MNTHTSQQDLLAVVYDLAALRHSAHRLEADARVLLEQAERNAARGGLPPSLIAKATALTPGRISQILSRPGEMDHGPGALARIADTLLEWPGEALKERKKDFGGEMTYPPYPAPRTRG